MIKFIRFVILVCLLQVLFHSESIAASYTDTLKECVNRIELGAYDRAGSMLDQAFAMDANDPLGHFALGVMYLHTSRLADAEKEFKEAAKRRQDDWRLLYASGLIAAYRGNQTDAERYLAAAAKMPAAAGEVAALREYLQYSKSAKLSETHAPGDPLLSKLTHAIARFNQADYAHAAPLFSEILRSPASLGFTENRSPLATYDPKKPISLPGGIFTWKPVQVKNAYQVSGSTTLTADTSRTGTPSFVLFYVDGILVGATNSSPFQFEWNTANHTNGLHQVRVEAKGETGQVISNKSIWVRVANDTDKRTGVRDGREVEELYDRLWNCTRLNEARSTAHYYMARIYLKSGNSKSGMEQLHYAIAYRTNFPEARKLLAGLRGHKSGYVEIRKGPPGSKKIALTFDDGPNEHTAGLLEILAKLKVPVTFFLVGFRAEAQPDLVKQIQDAGHQIENHSYSHPNLVTLSVDEAESELAKGAAVLLAITGKPSLYFRPPGGHADDATREAAARQGLRGAFWTVNCSPFEGAHYESLADHVIKNASDGGIVLMHNGEPATTSALPRIVRDLRAKGYTFVTLSELLK